MVLSAEGNTLVEHMRALSMLLARSDVDDCDERDLKAVTNETRILQRHLDGYIMKVGVRANTLATEGNSAPAEEIIRGAGTVSAQQARREAARAEVAYEVPDLLEVAARGETTSDHVDSVARHIGKLDSEQRKSIDFADLVERASHMLPEAFARHVKRQVDNARQDHGLAETESQQAASEFRHWFDESTGMGRFSGALDPERYEVLTNAIEHRARAIAAASNEEVSMSRNLAARALVEVLSANGNDAGPSRRSASVLVVVDHETLANGPHNDSIRQTETGRDIAQHSLARLCCDAVIRQVTLDKRGVPINVGRNHRTATAAQWAAIKVIYSTCAWDGCRAPINWCQAHHIHEWKHGGTTNLDNLVPLCSEHHHRVHEGQWQIKLLPDRSLKIDKPDGSHHATAPSPTRYPRPIK